jgi:hypothetical protein
MKRRPQTPGNGNGATPLYDLFRQTFGDSAFPLKQWASTHSDDPIVQKHADVIDHICSSERYYALQTVIPERERSMRTLDEDREALLRQYQEAGLDPQERFRELETFIATKSAERETALSAGEDKGMKR